MELESSPPQQHTYDYTLAQLSLKQLAWGPCRPATGVAISLRRLYFHYRNFIIISKALGKSSSAHAYTPPAQGPALN